MKSNACIFCDSERTDLPTCIKICELRYSRLYLFREQLHPGRCLLATKSHAAEVYDLPEEERVGFLAELDKVAQTLHKLYHADKMNFLSLGDTVGHVHIHIVPKKNTDPEWGGMFRFMEKTGYLSDEENNRVIDEIRTELKNVGILGD